MLGSSVGLSHKSSVLYASKLVVANTGSGRSIISLLDNPRGVSSDSLDDSAKNLKVPFFLGGVFRFLGLSRFTGEARRSGQPSFCYDFEGFYTNP